jgi:2-polyprenyl-3-methyl-5-hydroxy-6-metoxy-1,4-benzoquinol methylase
MNCLLCGRENTRPYLVVGEWTIVKCDCGMVYMDPQPTQEELDLLYAKDYVPYQQKLSYNSNLSPAQQWEASHSGLHYRVLRKIKRALIKPESDTGPVDMTRKTVLDYGYGNGRWLHRMKKVHPLWTLYGYDIDPRPLDGVIVITGLKELKFDIINLSHVVEHLPNPKETLLMLKEHLNEDGELHIEVPNIASWKFKVFGKHFANLCLPYHLSHFSPKTMAVLVTSCGLSMQSIEMAGGAKCTLRSIYSVLGIKKAINPYLNLAASFVTKPFRNTIDTDQFKIVAVMKNT